VGAAVQGDSSEAAPSTAGGPADLLMCGLPRSGTSLTRGLFAAHPLYAVPRLEMAWWVTLYPRFRRRPARWPAFLAALVDDAKTRSLQLDRRVLSAALAAIPPGAHLAAFDAVLRQFAIAQDRPRWGEKTLFAEREARGILAALPRMKVIHLIRDPRDVYASYLHAPWRTGLRGWSGLKVRVHGHLAWTLRNWRISVQLARVHAARWPERYRAVRYEDLVRDPAGTLQGLCAFAGVPFESGMLALDADSDLVERTGNSSFGPLESVSTAPIGRFRGVLTPREIALCDALAGEDLTRCGYARAGVRLDRGDAWRLGILDRPVARAVELAHGAAFRLLGEPR
jgi:hypothetical protein